MPPLARRTFLKLAALSLGGLAAGRLPPEDQPPAFGLGRSTAFNIAVQAEAKPGAKVLRRLLRDEVVTILEEIQGTDGPEGNPRWFRLLDGYVHSAHLQQVRFQENPVAYDFPETGRLMEVTVPFTQSHKTPHPMGALLYRLYYQAAVWVMGTSVDELGNAWYRIRDERLGAKYYVSAPHLRAFTPEELAPIRPEIPPAAKRIEVDLTRQQLTAFENDAPVLVTAISSGWLRKNPQPGESRTVTPTGSFRIYQKVPSRHMGNGQLTSNRDAYELPGVPFVSFFHLWGTAFHGAYWHNDFGRPCSQGCINMRPDEARWIYRWSLPSPPYAPNPPQVENGTIVRLYD
jgi:lipoprotein-anchoring transpeptidase ErfK/SrfK